MLNIKLLVDFIASDVNRSEELVESRLAFSFFLLALDETGISKEVEIYRDGQCATFYSEGFSVKTTEDGTLELVDIN